MQPNDSTAKAQIIAGVDAALQELSNLRLSLQRHIRLLNDARYQLEAVGKNERLLQERVTAYDTAMGVLLLWLHDNNPSLIIDLAKATPEQLVDAVIKYMEAMRDAGATMINAITPILLERLPPLIREVMTGEGS